MWHVEDVRDVILIFFECNAFYVKDVKDRSNTPKGCNAMYVEDVEDGKRTYRYILYHTFLNMVLFECNAIYVEDVKDNQIYLRAVMLCMSEMSKMGKEHTHTFWFITSLIFNGFSIRKKFWKAET